jgi:ubiquinone/menaquinone biosynthesis C-methylase UbiE
MKITDYGPLQERFRWISSIDHPEHPSLLRLDRSMKYFYQNVALQQDYHRIAESGNPTWDDHPLHRAIIEMISPDDTVVEFSCGSGYCSRHFAKVGCRYIGLDLSIQELVRTKKKELSACLLAGNAYQMPLASSSADFVISLYSLEHVVWPQRYLNEMRRVARAGGHIALAFPDYLKNPRGRPAGSMRFGRSPGGLRYKVAHKRWIDALQTFLERVLVYRAQVAKLRHRIYQKKQVRFLINTAPLCLVTEYASDNDAIYFANEEEIAQYLTRNGCAVIKRSCSVVNAPEGNGLVVAKVLRK